MWLYALRPSLIEIKDKAQGDILLHFGDIEVLDPPNLVHGDLFAKTSQIFLIYFI